MLQTTLYGNTPTTLNQVIEKALQGYEHYLVYNSTAKNGRITKVYRLEGLYRTAYLTTELERGRVNYKMGVNLEGDPSDYPKLSISLIQSGSML